MFITPDGTFYIADSGNGRIIKLQDFNIVASYGEGVLKILPDCSWILRGTYLLRMQA